jgi:hypothetical protein
VAKSRRAWQRATSSTSIGVIYMDPTAALR